MLKAIIFDFDGVIGNTFNINFELAKNVQPDLSEQDFKDHHNGNVFEEPKVKFKDEDVPIFFDQQKEMFTRKHIFPLESAIEELSKEYQLFIISSTRDDNIESFLKLGSLDGFFNGILGSTTHRSKVEKFKILFSEFDLQPEECVFITDTIGDILEGRVVGVKTIAVTWGFHDKESLAENEPYALVETTEALVEEIAKISAETL